MKVVLIFGIIKIKIMYVSYFLVIIRGGKDHGCKETQILVSVKKYYVQEHRPIIKLILSGCVKTFLVKEMQVARPEILLLKSVHLTNVQIYIGQEIKILVIV
jgi:hypothetical protein